MVSPSLVIQNAEVLLPGGKFILGELQIQEGQVVQVGTIFCQYDDRTVMLDANGLTLLPSVTDSHVHF